MIDDLEMEDEESENDEVSSLTIVEFRDLIVYMDKVNENDIIAIGSRPWYVDRINFNTKARDA